MKVKATLTLSMEYETDSAQQVQIFLKHLTRTVAFRDALAYYGVMQMSNFTHLATVEEVRSEPRPLTIAGIPILMIGSSKEEEPKPIPLIAPAPTPLSLKRKYSLTTIDAGWDT